MKDKYKDLVIDVALKYWPTNGKWQDDAREALSELESVNEQLDVTEIKKIIGDTISSSLLSAGTSQEELDVHVNVVLVEIQKRLKKKHILKFQSFDSILICKKSTLVSR